MPGKMTCLKAHLPLLLGSPWQAEVMPHVCSARAAECLCWGVQLRSAQEEASTMMASVTGERDDAVKRNADLRRRHAHFQHEIRRKEQDFERLQVSCLLLAPTHQNKSSPRTLQ